MHLFCMLRVHSSSGADGGLCSLLLSPSLLPAQDQRRNKQFPTH